jgi:hypothetical protein
MSSHNPFLHYLLPNRKSKERRTSSRNLRATKTSIYHSYFQCVCTEYLRLLKVNDILSTLCRMTHESQHWILIRVCFMSERIESYVILLFNLCHYNQAVSQLWWSEMDRQNSLYLEKKGNAPSQCHAFLPETSEYLQKAAAQTQN